MLVKGGCQLLQQYTMYAIMKNGSRYIFKIDDYYLKVLLGFVNGDIDHEVVKIMDILTMNELDFLSKLTNGECDYFLLKCKDSKIIRRIETQIFSIV